MDEKKFQEQFRALRAKAARFAFCIIGIGLACTALKLPFEVQKQLFMCAAFACVVMPEKRS
jgi:hypothetical protein